MKTINFMGVRNVAFAITVLLTVLALFSWWQKGLNFGLDFTGGTLIELTYERPADLKAVRAELVDSGFHEAVVQSFGATTDLLVRMPGDDPQLGNKVAAALQKAGGDNPATIKRVEFVGPQVGEELRDQGGLGMLLALGGILIYLLSLPVEVRGRRDRLADPRRGGDPGYPVVLPDHLRPDGTGGGAGDHRLLAQRHHRRVRPGA